MEIRRAPLPRRWLRAAVIAVVLVDVAVLGTDAFLLSQRSTTTRVDLQDALVKFRATASATPSPSVAGTAGPSAVATAAASAPTSSAPAATSTAPVATSSSVPAEIPVSSAPTATSGPPADGVYAYATAGGESVSVLGAHHDYPAMTYAAVHRTGGCGWTIQSEVIKEHVDRREMCTQAGSVLQLLQSREVTFFGTTEGGAYTCTPPQVQTTPLDGPGSRFLGDCGDGHGSTAHLVRTTLGRGTVLVGGVAVEVVQIRVDGTLTGKVRGTSSDLLTLVAATGLPVHWVRSIDTLADAFGTTVRYQEQARFDLQSLTPQT
jgi:hypothetical protein